jgi:hypothetical protein
MCFMISIMKTGRHENGTETARPVRRPGTYRDVLCSEMNGNTSDEMSRNQTGTTGVDSSKAVGQNREAQLVTSDEMAASRF